MGRRKSKGILDVSYSNRGRRGRGKKGLDSWAKMGGLGEKAFKNVTRRGRGNSRALGAIRDWFQKTDYIEERRRVMDDMEDNPQAIAREIKNNRVMQLPGTSALRQVVNMITSAAMRVQRRETKLDTDGKK